MLQDSPPPLLESPETAINRKLQIAMALKVLKEGAAAIITILDTIGSVDTQLQRCRESISNSETTLNPLHKQVEQVRKAPRFVMFQGVRKDLQQEKQVLEAHYQECLRTLSDSRRIFIFLSNFRKEVDSLLELGRHVSPLLLTQAKFLQMLYTERQDLTANQLTQILLAILPGSLSNITNFTQFVDFYDSLRSTNESMMLNKLTQLNLNLTEGQIALCTTNYNEFINTLLPTYMQATVSFLKHFFLESGEELNMQHMRDWSQHLNLARYQAFQQAILDKSSPCNIYEGLFNLMKIESEILAAHPTNRM